MASKCTQCQGALVIPRKYCFLVVVLVCLLLGYIVYRQVSIREKMGEAEFYRTFIKGYELDANWKMSREQLRREKKIIDRLLIEQGRHAITREQLGRQSWGHLHMITTTAPMQIEPEWREQFNAFLLLFGKLYPCKLCANYFMRILRGAGEFKGDSRVQLMDYMCDIHNRVNKRLGKRKYDCDMVSAEWGTCDCFSANPINNLK